MSEQIVPRSSGSKTCEEADSFIPSTAVLFVPCGKPAKHSVFLKNDDKTYRMCDSCAFHNVKNRGGVEIFEGDVPLVPITPSARIDLDDLAEDAEAAKKPVSTVTLAEVRALAEQQAVLEAEVENLESQLKAKKDALKDVAECLLPGLLADVGLTSLSLADGTKLEVQDNIFASIDDANREAAHAWLREHGHGDLIKNVVSVTFGKGEDVGRFC